MNVAQAKQLRMKDVLAALGCQPHHETKGEIWYPSPFRHESEPSFKINLERNIWYDFGEGEGGNILDFAMKYYATDLRGALRQLAALNIGTLLQPVTRPTTVPKRAAVKAVVGSEDGLTVTSIQPLINPALIGYLEQRCIPLEIARDYVQEMHYTRQGKPYFALAFANDSGGYELRNPYFKGTHSVKDITLVKRKGGTGSVSLFEGFMDMLSALVVYADDLKDTSLLVLNSVALKDKALAAIRAMGARTVQLFPDHDASGRELVAWFMEQLPGMDVMDQSGRYAGHKDVNAWLVAQQH
jgi:hypothetical protein